MLTCCMTPVLYAGGLTFTSTAQQNSVIELYTSEGCSSCPPAEAWLNKQLLSDKLWHQVIPVAFHVTYWDYLGWSDVFAQRAFDQRQRRLAQKNATGVYTPGVFLNGAEWRSWRRFPDGPPERTAPNVGQLTAKLTPAQTSVIQATFNPTHITDQVLYLDSVLLDTQLNTQVRAGENRGRRLTHQFVARHLQTASMRRNGQEYTGQLRLPETWRHHHAISIWVRTGDGEVLQATGGWLPETLMKRP